MGQQQRCGGWGNERGGAWKGGAWKGGARTGESLTTPREWGGSLVSCSCRGTLRRCVQGGTAQGTRLTQGTRVTHSAKPRLSQPKLHPSCLRHHPQVSPFELLGRCHGNSQFRHIVRVEKLPTRRDSGLGHTVPIYLNRHFHHIATIGSGTTGQHRQRHGSRDGRHRVPVPPCRGLLPGVPPRPPSAASPTGISVRPSRCLPHTPQLLPRTPGPSVPTGRAPDRSRQRAQSSCQDQSVSRERQVGEFGSLKLFFSAGDRLQQPCGDLSGCAKTSSRTALLQAQAQDHQSHNQGPDPGPHVRVWSSSEGVLGSCGVSAAS